MVVSRELLDELETVLLREKFRRYLSVDRAVRYIAVIERDATHLRLGPSASISRDPGDDYLVNLAWEARADCLVSGDGDLLDLEGEDLPRVWTPRRFLEELEWSLPPDPEQYRRASY